MVHIPVLVKEVLQYLNPKPGENFIDATIGEGGHAAEILRRTGPIGKLLGIDVDESQIKNSRLNLSEFKERLILVNDSYNSVRKIAEEMSFNPVDGILLDLGFSSWHLEESGRGFTFKKDEPLDMRYHREIANNESQVTNELTAEKIVNEWPEKEIEKVIREFGQERFSRRIARKIVQERKNKKIKSTANLKDIIEKAVPTRFQKSKIHFATKTFQALRIAVNRELENLKTFVPMALEILSKDGRLVIISFHSLEDRIVKNFFVQAEKSKIANILTKKPIGAESDEMEENPRVRSAKLRAIIKI